MKTLLENLESWKGLSDSQQALIFARETERRRSTRLFQTFYPETGPLRRELYPRHMEFFRAGAKYNERAARCANRVGKTIGMGGYELTCHLTGDYPEWWEGRRFPGQIKAWMAGRTNETTRDIVQAKMLGPIVYEGSRKRVAGTGLIPGERLGIPTWKQGVANMVDTITVKHKCGELSLLGVKAYKQGRGSFEGVEQDVIWLDEEPPMDVYGECLIRTMTTNGIIMLTFTPLLGIDEVVLSFMPKEMRPAA